MKWLAQAPSNIALIKYMGKTDESVNVPMNPSLSYTLNSLISSVELESHPGDKDLWEPLDIPGALNFTLSTQAQQRFLRHLDFIKKTYDFSGSFIVRSCNNFPLSSGLASSASSFAALTKCAIWALTELTEDQEPDIQTFAKLSRHGSGSSCRSFFSPWALWDENKVEAIELPQKDLIHQVIIISHEHKRVSSSQAHRLIKTSPYYPERAQRAKANLKLLLDAMRSQDWQQMFEIVWREFHDMHQLFSSSSPSFQYMNEESKSVLNLLYKLWEKHGDGPLVTMDAGPNIHLLYRLDQRDLALKIKQDHFIGNYDVF